MSATRIRPDTKPEPPVDKDTEKTIRERMTTYDQDKKDAKPWPEVKARILQQLKPR